MRGARMRSAARTSGFTLIELLIVVAIIGIIAAIAIPSLLRARIAANESAGVGDVRAVISAQHAYAASNASFYGRISCLGNPPACNFGAGTTPFVDTQLAGLTTKQGYARSFFAGDPGAGSVEPGLVTFVYFATPATVAQTGNRGFGGDNSGLICATQDGSAPAIDGVSKALEATCTPLK